MKAIILATTEDATLLPLTATRPKHLIKVAGKPIIQHCLKTLQKAGITETLIVIRDSDKETLEKIGNSQELGLKIDYIKQSSVLGTGNASNAAEPYVSSEFVLVDGESLFSEEALKHLIQVFEEHRQNAVVAIVNATKAEDVDTVELEKDLKIKRIIKRSALEKTSSNLAKTNLYIFKENIFKTSPEIRCSDQKEIELTNVISSMLKDDKAVYATEIPKEEWIDIRNPWDLLEANTWILKRMEHKVLGTVEEGAHILGPVTVASTARIRSGAYIEGPSLIDEGADIGPNCYIRPCTSLGKNTRVGNACEIKNSIIMDRTHVGHLSYVGDSIIGEHCNIAAGTLVANLRFDNGSVKMMVNERVVDTGRRKLGVILGDEVKTGINALLMPGVKVGQNSWVGPDCIVQRDVNANTITMVEKKGITPKKITS